jgi:hypothetical protein
VSSFLGQILSIDARHGQRSKQTGIFIESRGIEDLAEDLHEDNHDDEVNINIRKAWEPHRDPYIGILEM